MRASLVERSPRGRPELIPVVHVRYGFEFLGYKIKRGYKKLHLPESKIRNRARQDALYAYPKEKSIRRFMEQVRQRTKRTLPLKTKELIEELNPLLRGWGEYCKRAHIRKLSQRLDGWGRYKPWGAMLAGNGCLVASSTASTSLFV